MPLNLVDPQLNIYIILAALWTLPWKGWALWRAATRKERGWFIALLIINTLGILEIVYIFFIGKDKSEKPAEANREMAILGTADAELKDKILDAAKEWKKITVSTASNLVQVSETEAEVLLEHLRTEGKLRRLEKHDGTAVYSPR